MGHVVEQTGEQYATLQAVAAKSDETLEQFIGRMVDVLTEMQGAIYYTDDELLRALCADDEDIAALSGLEAASPNADE
ncbi:MAG: hypothetical protein ACXWQR_10820 [Ktedonobacterales bacterium]